MKRTTRILLIAVTILVCLICLGNAAYIIIQGGGMAGLYGVNMERAQWNQEVLGLQCFIFWGWLTAGLVFDALLAVFMIRSLLAVRSGILFPKANTFLLMAASAVNLVYNICLSNIGIVLHSERLFTIDNADLLLPLILFARSESAKKTDSPSKLTAMAIIVNIDIMLARRKMSSGELAAKVGITPANLSILKTGKARAIRFTTLEALCRALDCQPGDILEYRADSH